MDAHVKLENPGINGEETKISHNFQVSSLCRRSSDKRHVQQHNNGKPRPLTILLIVQVPKHTKSHQTHHIHLHIPTNSHQPAINTVSLLYTCKHQPLTSTLHIFNPTNTKFLPHHLHKITKALTTIQTNNKCTNSQHNYLLHNFHIHSTLRFHYHIFHNTHLLTVHLQIVLTL